MDNKNDFYGNDALNKEVVNLQKREKESNFIYNFIHGMMALLIYVFVGIVVVIGGYKLYIELDGFYLSDDEISINVDNEYDINVLGKHINKKNSNYTFKSSDDQIVSVSSNGVVKALSVGTAKITVKSKYSDQKKFLKVNVISSNITSLNFDVKSLSIQIGTQYTVKALVNDKENYNGKVIFSTEDENIATINSQGMITAIGIGSTYVNLNVEGSDLVSKLLVEVYE